MNGESGRAAFKIWDDTVYNASTTELTAAAKKLATSVINNNTFTLTGENVYCDFQGLIVDSLDDVK